MTSSSKKTSEPQPPKTDPPAPPKALRPGFYLRNGEAPPAFWLCTTEEGPARAAELATNFARACFEATAAAGACAHGLEVGPTTRIVLRAGNGQEFHIVTGGKTVSGAYRFQLPKETPPAAQ